VKAGFLADAVVGSLKVNALVGTYEEHADAVENAELIAVALDSAAGRIGAQALLPNRIVNAWTQHSDLGVSSHPSFGEHPCLACLYLPSGAQRSTYQMYADALGEDEVRVMAYAATGIPVGQPLPPEVTMNLPRRMSLPEGADRWLAVPILDDLVERGRLDQADAARFAMARVSDFYREAVCGGVFVRIEGSDEAAEVPLAHQSMLAGVLLAVAATMQAKSPLEARVDLMKHSPRIHKQPRQPTPGCICRDEIYRERFTAKWESSPSLGELGGGS
jgi:hypothetical protein